MEPPNVLLARTNILRSDCSIRLAKTVSPTGDVSIFENSLTRCRNLSVNSLIRTFLYSFRMSHHLSMEIQLPPVSSDDEAVTHTNRCSTSPTTFQLLQILREKLRHFFEFRHIVRIN